MRFMMIKGNDVSVLAKRKLTDEEIHEFQKVLDFAGRVSIYGFPATALFWCWLAWPDLFPENRDLPMPLFFLGGFGILLLVPLIHELLHLLAVPSKMFLKDTLFILMRNGIRTNVMIRPGGHVSPWQFMWISIVPFLILTVLPFILLALKIYGPYWLGFIACYNFGLSAIDMMNVVVQVLQLRARKN